MITLMLIIVKIIGMRIDRTPIHDATYCHGVLTQQLAQCRVDFPNEKSVDRHVCDAGAWGQYFGCLEGCDP